MAWPQCFAHVRAAQPAQFLGLIYRGIENGAIVNEADRHDVRPTFRIHCRQARDSGPLQL